ncbi:MAG: serine/threonine protein kinase [Ruminococcaceae bacterium]|nr:serine/threonine protein kinase [Oscillospiraceae bacterium]
MNTYEQFILETLEKEFDSVVVFKDAEHSHIELFRNVSNGKKLVFIKSKNRNDHIFRRLRGYSHPNLPMIYEVCSCDEYLLILESFVEGNSLADILKDTTISTKQAVKYALQVCEALKLLHSKQIIHRDIKPENIVITPENKAVLIDLQAARLVTDKDASDTVNLGTVGYAAPEQFGLHQSIPPTDIYAIGVLLNEMTVNCHPIIKTPSGKLGKIIKKCTETGLYNRYQTVEKLIADLKRV